jgi:hypothetical protein
MTRTRSGYAPRAAGGDDLVAEINALVADVHAIVVGCNEHFDLLPALSAKRAREISFRSRACTHGNQTSQR